MKKYLLTSTAAGAALALTVPAQADGMYASIFGGMTKMDDQSMQVATDSGSWNFFTSGNVYQSTPVHLTSFPFTSLTIPWYFVTWPTGGTHYGYGVYANVTYEFESHTNWTTDYIANFDIDNGFVIGAAIGAEYDGGFSVELEVASRQNDVAGSITTQYDWLRTYEVRVYYNTFVFTMPSYSMITLLHFSLTASNVTGSTPFHTSGLYTELSGDVSSFSIMANAWYEIDTESGVNPYIGGGIGYANVKLDLGSGMDFEDGSVAYQFGLGIRCDITESLSMSLELRHFEVPGVDLSDSDYNLEDFEYKSDEILVGVRFGF